MGNGSVNKSVYVKKRITFWELGDSLWGEAKRRWESADLETKKVVWDKIVELLESSEECGQETTFTDINYMIWFEFDEIFYPEPVTLEIYITKENFNKLYFKNTYSGVQAIEKAKSFWERNKNSIFERAKTIGEKAKVVTFIIKREAYCED